jgi:hypothetical protein
VSVVCSVLIGPQSQSRRNNSCSASWGPTSHSPRLLWNTHRAESITERKSGLEKRDYGRRGSVALTMRHPFIRKKLALTSPTSGGHSVGIVRSRTKATELVTVHWGLQLADRTWATYSLASCRSMTVKRPAREPDHPCPPIAEVRGYLWQDCTASNPLSGYTLSQARNRTRHFLNAILGVHYANSLVVSLSCSSTPTWNFSWTLYLQCFWCIFQVIHRL